MLGLTVPPSLLAIADEVIERSDARSYRSSAVQQQQHGRSMRMRNRVNSCGWAILTAAGR
jgi:hypothetical protein